MLSSRNPDRWGGSQSRSTLRFCTLHHRSTAIQNWGFYFLDFQGALARDGESAILRYDSEPSCVHKTLGYSSASKWNHCMPKAEARRITNMILRYVRGI